MPTPLTYATLQTELITALVQAPPPYNIIPPDFASLYPNAISYAESRICAEIPLLANRAQNNQLTTAAGSRVLNLSGMTNPLVVMERLALVTPREVIPSAGTRWQYIKTTLDFIDVYWPDESITQPPSLNGEWGGRYWAPLNTGSTSAAYTGSSSIIVIAPTPDDIYVGECTGLFQPTPLSVGNPTTYLSVVYPDLLVSACLLFLSGALMRNFGAASSNPQAALSWEANYEVLKSACEFEEMRRRGLSPDHPRQSAPQAPV